MRTTTETPSSFFSMSRSRSSAYLVSEPLPACACEEVREDRAEPPDGRAQPFVDVVLATRLVRPVNQQRLPLDVIPRQEPPVPAVLRVVAVVPHHEVVIRGHRHGRVV